MFRLISIRGFFIPTLFVLMSFLWQSVFASEIKITALIDNQSLSINFAHEKDVFPVLSYENKYIVARFYRAIQLIQIDNAAKKLLSVEYIQTDKRAIKINLTNHNFNRSETKIGKTQSSIKLYASKDAVQIPCQSISTYLAANSRPAIKIPHCFDTLAAFKRGNEIWLVMTGDTKAINFASKSKDKIKFRRIKCPNALVVACEVGKLDYVKLQYGSNHTAEILLAPLGTKMTNQNNLEYHESENKHIWNIPSNYQICKMYDEKTNENLHVVSIKDFVFGINKSQDFGSFNLQKSLQGLVFVSKSEELPISCEKNDVVIKKSESQDSCIQLESSLPWHYEGNFLNQKQAIEAALNEADTNEEKYIATKRLANLHFSKCQYHETLSLLESIKDYEFFRKEIETQLLYAVASYMTKEIKNAQKMLDLIQANNKPEAIDREVLLWAKIVRGESLKKSVLLDLENFISEYHDEVYWSLVFSNLIQNLQESNITDSKELLSRLRSCDDANIKEKLTYFKAMIDYQMGNKSIARKNLEAIANAPIDSTNKAMIKASLAKIRYEDNEISLSDAIKELENCTIFRGDNDLEKSLLLQLADLYQEQKDLISELRTLKYIKDFLDLDPLSCQRISNLYETIFIKRDVLSNIEPLKQLALFYEFEELMPIGNLGDAIALLIANNLINLDLLDQAEAILEHQIKYRTTGFKKEKLAENLTCTFLVNNKPEKALSLLNSLPNENDSFEKHQKRLQLKAIASMLTEKYDIALQYVQHDISKEGLIIKKEILFKGGKWKEYASLARPQILSLMTTKNAQLSLNLKQDILRFALSCTMIEDDHSIKMLISEIKKIDDQFSKALINLLSHNPLEELKNLENMQQVNQLNDIIMQYRSEFWHQATVQ